MFLFPKLQSSAPTDGDWSYITRSNVSDVMQLHLRATQGFIHLFFHICRKKTCKHVSSLMHSQGWRRSVAFLACMTPWEDLTLNYIAFIHLRFYTNTLYWTNSWIAEIRTVQLTSRSQTSEGLTQTWDHYRSCERVWTNCNSKWVTLHQLPKTSTNRRISADVTSAYSANSSNLT